jgi:hypothetical protein
MFLYVSIDEDMVRCALTPRSQQACVVWLENHFEVYGDKAPNRLATHISAVTKKDVYSSYMEESGGYDDVVSYSTFINLWNCLFPNVKSRPWVDVPGKCNTCYLIDDQRKSATDREVQRHLGLAHQLHRGGFFMLEREK